MARFLFCVWPAPGHVYPSLPIAVALRQAGQAVGYVTTPDFAGILAPHDIDYLPLRREAAPDGAADSDVRRSSDGARDGRALFRALFITPAPAIARSTIRAMRQFQPDVLVHDQRSFAPAIAAEHEGIPLATLTLTCCPLPAENLAPFGTGLPPALDEETRARYAQMRRRSEDAYAGILAEWNIIRAGFGLPPHQGLLATSAISPDLVILPNVPELDYDRGDLPPQARYVGPCSWDPPAPLDEQTAAWLAALPSDMPLALVTASTASANRTADARSAALVEAALAGLPNAGIAVLATLPFDHPLHDTTHGAFTRVVRFAPHSMILPRTAIVLTHGGFGIVTKALRAARPLVVIPFAGDQPEVAQRVAWAGAGVRLDPSALSPVTLRHAVTTVLGDADYGTNARRVAAAMGRHEGPSEAAHLLIDLALRRSMVGRPALSLEAAR